MPQFIVTGSKVLKDGQTHTITEVAASSTKAQWTAAHYVAHGYTVQINEKEK